MRQRKAKTEPKPLQELNLSDNFLFGEVMYDETACKAALEIILDREIAHLINVNKEKHFDVDNAFKGIRLDIYFKDDENTVYSVEMQTENRYHIPKRSRHYQSVIDIKILPAGERDYAKLSDCIIIFICTFDLFGRGKYCYVFENRCSGMPELLLGDGTKKIFLNTRGCNPEGVSPELIEFLKYVEDSIQFQPVTDKVKRIAERVHKVKEDVQVEARYMTAITYKKELLAEGRAEGRVEGRAEGAAQKLIEQIYKKLEKNKEVQTIAEELEESLETVKAISKIIESCGADCDIATICEKYADSISEEI